MSDYLAAIILGMIEGITEFLPISSTGHLILFSEIMRFQAVAGHVFEVFIQLGAILAICWMYRRRLWSLITAPLQQENRSLLMLLALGFAPAAVIGFVLHDFVKEVLFSPLIVSLALVIGGIAILLIERFQLEGEVRAIEQITPLQALQIGFCQVLAMIPGTSRSGATIMGGRLLGLDHKTAAEFSFFLAIPTMFAASLYDLYRNRALIDGSDAGLLVIGFITAFASALLSIRWLLQFVSRHSFVPFGWYRIGFGLLMLVLMRKI